MSAFNRLFLRDDRFQAFLGNRIHLGLFGKHKSYDDFLKIALESQSVKIVEPLVFQDGIKHQIVSWRKNPNAIAFEHAFLWQRGGQSIVGRFWHSADSLGRSDHPLVVCVHGHALPTQWFCEQIWPELESVKSRCLEANSLDQVNTIAREAKRALGTLAKTAPSEDVPVAIGPTVRSSFVGHPDLGPKHERLTRTMVAVASDPAQCASRLDTTCGPLMKRASMGAGWGRRPRATHLRVPCCSTTAGEAFLNWSDFLNYLIGWEAPKLLVLPIGREWLDILIGEPAPDQFGFLRLPLSELGYTGDLSAPIKEGLQERAEAVLRGYLSSPADSLTAGQKIVRILGLVLIPLLAGIALAGYLRFSPPENIPKFLHALAHRLGNVEINSNP